MSSACCNIFFKAQIGERFISTLS